MGRKDQSSVGKPDIMELVRKNMLRRTGLKITPAQREYYRYTGISAEVEKHCVLDPSDQDISRVPDAKTEE